MFKHIIQGIPEDLAADLMPRSDAELSNGVQHIAGFIVNTEAAGGDTDQLFAILGALKKEQLRRAALRKESVQ